ncbi:Bacterial membrane flanked domain protein [compost metagenome]
MQNFSNSTIDLDTLPKYEETALTAPAPKYWRIIVINLIIFLFIIAAGLGTLLLINDEVQSNWLIFVGIFAAFAAFLFLIFRASFKRRGFALREKDILYKSGVIAETTIIVPLNRIQHVSLSEGVLSRMFALGTLQIYTAGGSSGEIKIAGIPIEQAKALKEALVQRLVVNPETESE